jgi:xanthine dehydrogenase YagS FAD-binding subunit
VNGENRYYHSVMGGRHCIAVHPSDLAPALIALEATATVAGPDGQRTIPVEHLWTGFGWQGGQLRNHTLAAGEVVTRIEVPSPASGARTAFVKFRLRNSWDFALGLVAANLTMDGRHCTAARVVLGGVATRPVRALGTEAALAGQDLTDDVIERAANAAMTGAKPLVGNRYKLALLKGLCRKALRSMRQDTENPDPI